ncbi:SpoIIE family protein phosphatase [Streptomyces malaysiense]|uniref:PPM-type phosphatase domain-containing protein n=1 Tax=Streptomyces malaysiense TaxID=1428626 RepID=A0A1J4PS15_9ACTN|nr:SpoIIE family protein phosphatase [Streptomyces malaysiense]OIK23545.1 hypothetical protein VT52_031955 [Streptomyces malaysiense]
MTQISETWTLTGPVDAARARALLARLTADAGVPARDRARFLAVLTALLRPCREGRRQRLTVTADEDLHIALDGSGPWRHTLACPAPPPRPLPRPDDLAEADLAEALLGAGEDTAVVLAGLDEAEELVRFHREELHQTNQGVLGVPVPYEYEEHREELPDGATLALYTDGLVERRSAGIDAGIERLARALDALGVAQLERLDAAADALLEPMLRDSEHDDDICLLLCRTAV